MAEVSERRRAMVERQLEARGIDDPAVLTAMREVPRERFVPEAMAEFAYEDSPLPIEAGQTISQPYIVGLMIEAAEIGPGDRILEIGVGSGYAARGRRQDGRRRNLSVRSLMRDAVHPGLATPGGGGFALD